MSLTDDKDRFSVEDDGIRLPFSADAGCFAAEPADGRLQPHRAIRRGSRALSGPHENVFVTSLPRRFTGRRRREPHQLGPAVGRSLQSVTSERQGSSRTAASRYQPRSFDTVRRQPLDDQLRAS